MIIAQTLWNGSFRVLEVDSFEPIKYQNSIAITNYMKGKPFVKMNQDEFGKSINDIDQYFMFYKGNWYWYNRKAIIRKGDPKRKTQDKIGKKFELYKLEE